MIVSPKGWMTRKQGALYRKYRTEMRRPIDAARQAFYDGKPVPKLEDLVSKDVKTELDQVEIDQMRRALAKSNSELQSVVEKTEDEDSKPKADPYEKMTAKQLKDDLEDAGLEVPPGTARARLVDLHKQHTKKK